MKNSILLSLVLLCLVTTALQAQINIGNKKINVQTPSKEITSEMLEMGKHQFKNGQIVFIQSAAQNNTNLFLAAKKNP